MGDGIKTKRPTVHDEFVRIWKENYKSSEDDEAAVEAKSDDFAKRGSEYIHTKLKEQESKMAPKEFLSLLRKADPKLEPLIRKFAEEFLNAEAKKTAEEKLRLEKERQKTASEKFRESLPYQ